MKTQVIGEYKNVSRMTREPELLKKAHESFISREQALAIVRERQPKLEVRFNGYRGRCPKHRRWITLPSEKEIKSNGVHGRLRVGIVLHELCHYETKNMKHGIFFTFSFDELLRWFYEERTPSELI